MFWWLGVSLEQIFAPPPCPRLWRQFLSSPAHWLDREKRNLHNCRLPLPISSLLFFFFPKDGFSRLCVLKKVQTGRRRRIRRRRRRGGICTWIWLTHTNVHAYTGFRAHSNFKYFHLVSSLLRVFLGNGSEGASPFLPPLFSLPWLHFLNLNANVEEWKGGVHFLLLPHFQKWAKGGKRSENFGKE